MSQTVYSAAVLNAGLYERQRQFVVRAVFFIYILSLLEGPLRKWFLPGLAGPLTLLRDPFVISLYVYCFFNGLMMRRGVAAIWLSFAVLTSWFGLIQFAMNGLPITGWMLGVRTYWLYMPLAFVIAQSFRPVEVLRFLRMNLWIALPYAVLMVIQYGAGGSAWINRGVGGDETAAVGVGVGILRPFGLYTYTGPNVQFTAFMIAILIAIFLVGRQYRPPLPIFLAMATAVGTMSVLTGSRSIYFQAGIILGFTILGLLAKRVDIKTLFRITAIFGFVALAGFLFVEVFPDMFAAMTGRFDRAARSEGSIWVRAFSGLTRPIDALGTAPLLGYGIGAGAPGVARFLQLPSLIYGESDLERNINELGLVFGVVMLLLRFGTAFWVGIMILSHTHKRNLVMLLPIAGQLTYSLAIGQITHSPINAFLVWINLGLLISLNGDTNDEINRI